MKRLLFLSVLLASTVSAEVNIAEVSGKFDDTRKAAIAKAISVREYVALRLALEALGQAHLAGVMDERLRCEQIYDVEIATDTEKKKEEK